MRARSISPLDSRSVVSYDLFSILSELSERRMLGSLNLVKDAAPRGFLAISPKLTAELIKVLSTLPADAIGRHTSIVFDRDRISLRIYDYTLLEYSNLIRIAKLCAFAGFSRKTKKDESFEFAAIIYPSEEYYVYALSINRLRDVFRKYFPEL